MEADWSVEIGCAEIGGSAPVIDTGWPGWIDLAGDAEQMNFRINSLSEVRSFPPLGIALRKVLRECANFRSTKCDFWTDDLAPEVADSEAICPEGGNCQRLAVCYIDLLPQNIAAWTQLAAAEAWARAFVSVLRAEHCPHGRVEIVVREAFSTSGFGFGLPLYIYGCGPTETQARTALEHALCLAVRHICATPSPQRKTESALQWQQESRTGE